MQLIARGKGHAVVHETGIHGGPSLRVVAVVAVMAFVFGSSVLLAELVDGSSGGGHGTTVERAAGDHGGAPAGHEQQSAAVAVRGLSPSAAGLTLELDRAQLPRVSATTLRFQISDRSGAAVRDFQVEHDKRMHLIVVRRDLTGFQHLHPTSMCSSWPGHRHS